MKKSGIKDIIVAAIISIAIMLLALFFIGRLNIEWNNPIMFPIKYILVMLTIALTFLIRSVIVDSRNAKIKNKTIDTELLNEDATFESIYADIRKKHEPELNKIRKGALPLLVAVIILGIIAGGIFVWMAIAKINIGKYSNFILDNTMLIKILPVIAAGLFFCIYFWLAFKKSAYREKYKASVVADLVNATNDGLVFSVKGGMAEPKLLNSYKHAAFDDNYFNTSITEDYIMGCLTDEVAITMAEVYLNEAIYSGKNKREVEVFRGLFAQVYGISGFKGTLKILNNSNKIRESNVQNLIEVKMDSSEFENVFNVYAEDPILAMRVLTSDIMQKLVEFETRLGIHYELVIKGRELYLRFFTKTLFESSIYNESKEKYRLRQCYEIINLIKDIAVEINKTTSEIEI